LLALTIIPSSADAAVIVPDGLADVEANANNGYPFNLTVHGMSSLRYQQVYDATAFTDLMLIAGIRFRPDNGRQPVARRSQFQRRMVHAVRCERRGRRLDLTCLLRQRQPSDRHDRRTAPFHGSRDGVRNR
jgi:hypothetical protein